MADVPTTLHVYLTQPQLGLPPPEQVRHGPPPKNVRVISGARPIKVRDVARLSDSHFQRIQVRNTERGVLDDAFTMRPVWTVREGAVAQEWLVIRQEKGQGDKGPVYFYALCNASPNSEPHRLAWLKCMRYFIERANQDSKSEVGWGSCKHRSIWHGSIIWLWRSLRHGSLPKPSWTGLRSMQEIRPSTAIGVGSIACFICGKCPLYTQGSDATSPTVA